MEIGSQGILLLIGLKAFDKMTSLQKIVILGAQHFLMMIK